MPGQVSSERISIRLFNQWSSGRAPLEVIFLMLPKNLWCQHWLIDQYCQPSVNVKNSVVRSSTVFTHQWVEWKCLRGSFSEIRHWKDASPINMTTCEKTLTTNICHCIKVWDPWRFISPKVVVYWLTENKITIDKAYKHGNIILHQNIIFCSEFLAASPSTLLFSVSIRFPFFFVFYEIWFLRCYGEVLEYDLHQRHKHKGRTEKEPNVQELQIGHLEISKLP